MVLARCLPEESIDTQVLVWIAGSRDSDSPPLINWALTLINDPFSHILLTMNSNFKQFCCRRGFTESHQWEFRRFPHFQVLLANKMWASAQVHMLLYKQSGFSLKVLILLCVAALKSWGKTKESHWWHTHQKSILLREQRSFWIKPHLWIQSLNTFYFKNTAADVHHGSQSESPNH